MPTLDAQYRHAAVSDENDVAEYPVVVGIRISRLLTPAITGLAEEGTILFSVSSTFAQLKSN